MTKLLSSLEAVKGKSYETILSMSKVKVCAEGLECNAESEVSLRHTFNYYTKVHMESTST